MPKTRELYIKPIGEHVELIDLNGDKPEFQTLIPQNGSTLWHFVDPEDAKRSMYRITIEEVEQI